MVGIYAFKNNFNNKYYIGKSINIHKRYLQHKSDFKKKDTKFYRAIRKYGFENFSFLILEECKKGNLNEREKYWIKHYNSYYDGYNSTTGGENNYIQSIEANLKHSGENHVLSVLTENDVFNIREYRLKGRKRLEVYDLYKDKISLKGFQHIWQGDRWKHIHYDIYDKIKKTKQQKPLNSDDIVYNVRLDFMNGLSKKEIIDKYSIERRTIERWLKLETRTNINTIPKDYNINLYFKKG